LLVLLPIHKGNSTSITDKAKSVQLSSPSVLHRKEYSHKYKQTKIILLVAACDHPVDYKVTV